MNHQKYFKRMYKAHETVASVSERICRLYESSASVSAVTGGMPRPATPDHRRLSGIVAEIADLQSFAEDILRQRAAFDLFICGLDPFHARLLSLRCEEGLAWKNISYELKISTTTAKDILKRIESGADDFGLFRPNSSKIVGQND